MQSSQMKKDRKVQWIFDDPEVPEEEESISSSLEKSTACNQEATSSFMKNIKQQTNKFEMTLKPEKQKSSNNCSDISTPKLGPNKPGQHLDVTKARRSIKPMNPTSSSKLNDSKETHVLPIKPNAIKPGLHTYTADENIDSNFNSVVSTEKHLLTEYTPRGESKKTTF